MGVVYHTHFLDYFEEARTEALRAHGLPYKALEDAGVMTPVVEAQVRYHGPARYDDLLEIETAFEKPPRARILTRYAVRLTRMTRRNSTDDVPDFIRDYVNWGAGPRASQYLVLAGKARAVLYGRYHVSTEDIRAVAVPILRHRIVTNFNAEAEGLRPDDIVARIEGKSSLGRLGLIVHATAGFCDPGWKGTLTLELANLTRVPILLRPGLPIAQLSFMTLDRAAERPYGHPELGSHYHGQVEATASRYEGGPARISSGPNR